MRPRLLKYYLLTTLIPLVINVLGTIAWLIYDNRWGALSQLPKDQLEGGSGGVNLPIILLALGNGAALAALSTPIFLNANTKIRNSIALSWLTWSLLPIIWMVFVWFFVDADELEIVMLVAPNILPYLIVHPWIFVKYRKALRATPVEPVAADSAQATAPITDSMAAPPTDPQPSPPAAPAEPEH